MCDLVGINPESEMSKVVSFDNERCGGCGTICFTEIAMEWRLREKKSTIWLVLRNEEKKGEHNYNPKSKVTRVGDSQAPKALSKKKTLFLNHVFFSPPFKTHLHISPVAAVQ